MPLFTNSDYCLYNRGAGAMNEPLFTRRPEEYVRDINIIDGAVEQAALFLHKKTNIDMATCVDWAKQKLSDGGDFALKDPMAQCLVKIKPGERTRVTVPWSKYIKNVIDQGNLISPTMAVYLPKSKKPSIISEYIAGNIKARADFKKKMFDAESNGDKVMQAYYDIQQTSTKLKNNGLSGAHASDHNPLYNSSTHSTLTSTCRCTSSYGAATNEQMLAGMRHYWSPEIVIFNILAIVSMTELSLMPPIMEKYGLVYPTAEDAMECIRRSCKRYWVNTKRMQDIQDLVVTLKPVELAALLYCGDLYHLAKLNPQFVRGLIGSLAKKGGPLPDNVDATVKGMDMDMNTMVSLLCRKEMSGKNIKWVKANNPEAFNTFVGTAHNANTVLESYRDFIKAFWVTPNLPPTIANLPSIIRDVVIAFDTDSNIFTTEYWTEWYVGKLDFSELSYDVSFVIAYLASQRVVHVLAMMSANMGIPTEHIHRLAMKNEYWFPIFTLTNMAKHYYAIQAAKEGNVKAEYELEVKGVNMRGSNTPAAVMKEFHGWLMELMDYVIREGNLPIDWILDHVAFKEETIRMAIRSGSPAFMRRTQIKAAKSYKNPQSSSFVFHGLWEDVFAPKYGYPGPPPYTTVDAKLEFKNPTDVRVWLEGMEDRELAARMSKWMGENNKTMITHILMPAGLVRERGIPKEIETAVNIRKLIYTTLSCYYLTLESLGIFMINDNLTQLVSDYHVIKPDSHVLKKAA